MEPTQFVRQVVYLFDNRESVFKNKVNVEDWVPSDFDNVGKSSFLFYLTQLDYAIKSQLLYEGSHKLLAVYPNYFHSKTILGLNQKELTDSLATYLRPRYINEAVCRYQSNSRKLEDQYKGDPQNIFKETSAVEVLKKIWEFRGFGPKTGNLFFRSMVTTFNYEFSDIDKVLPPVDIHDVRIAKLLDYISSDEMTASNVLKVKHLWNQACIDAGINWLKFDKALWLLGAFGKPENKQDILKLLLL